MNALHDPKQLWKSLNTILYNKIYNTDRNVTIHEIIAENVTTITDTKLICNELNRFFINIGHNLSNELLRKPNFIQFQVTLNKTISNSKYIDAFDEDIIRQCVNSIKPSNNFGSDHISINLIKKISRYYCQY